ncbi:MAG: NRDE family protein [Pseudomonadota bacterium]
MCLIAWNWQPDSATPLLLLANRDEFYARAALPLHWWEPAADGTQILAGKDLQGGGTWLGLSRTGRLAALTNFRCAEPQRTNTPSRGELVAGFLHSDLAADAYLHQLALHCGDYNPFNLLVFDGQQLMGLESRGAKVLHHAPGLGAVSNADFQTPWPKLVQLQSGLAVHAGASDMADLRQFLPLLQDRSQAPDSALPHTGVPLALERVLSAVFIATTGYGTRACSVVALHQDHAEFIEQSFGPQGLISETRQQFLL